MENDDQKLPGDNDRWVKMGPMEYNVKTWGYLFCCTWQKIRIFVQWWEIGLCWYSKGPRWSATCIRPIIQLQHATERANGMLAFIMRGLQEQGSPQHSKHWVLFWSPDVSKDVLIGVWPKFTGLVSELVGLPYEESLIICIDSNCILQSSDKWEGSSSKLTKLF